MTFDQSQNGVAAPVADIKEIEAMGQELVATMQSVRKLLEARARALEGCRCAFEEHYARLEEQRAEIAHGETQCCESIEKREAELGRRESELETLCKSPEEAQSSLDREKSDWKQKRENLIVSEDQLADQRAQLAARETQVTDEFESFEKLESELTERATLLEQQGEELEQERAQISSAQEEWHTKLDELNRARDSLSALQRELENELAKVAEQEGELLPRYGVPPGEPTASTAADVDVPSTTEQEARESMERFQKLCRDAKRRAIGA